MKDEVVLVTGASRGIGRAVALECARRGAHVAVHYNTNTAAAHAVVAEIQALGQKALAFSADLAKTELPADAISAIAAELGPVRRIVCNAGMSLVEMSAFMDLADFDQVIELNLRGALVTCQAFLPKMIKAGKGSIVFVSSAAGSHGFAGMGAYSASKAGLLGLGKSMAQELAPRGIRVNVVTPGLIETDMLGEMPDENRARFVEQTPLGRLGTADEVARAIAFLLSDDASFVTGQVLAVNGGLFC